MQDSRTPAVSMRNITKTFGTIVANNKVDLDIYKGEILSLLGENGSGKTTLMNMLSGIYYPDEGEILIDGKPVQISSPKDAYDYGIGMIHQHFKLVNIFSAAQNIILGMESDQGVKNTRFGKRQSAFARSATFTDLMSILIRRFMTCPYHRSRQ